MSKIEKAGGRGWRGMGPVERLEIAAARNTEKRKSVDQKANERFERVREYLVARPGLFARQGSVVAYPPPSALRRHLSGSLAEWSTPSPSDRSSYQAIASERSETPCG